MRIMKRHLLLSLAAATVVGLTATFFTTQAVAQVNNGMPGIVMAGSQDYSQIPEKARKFVEKHFKGINVSKCERYYAKGKYEVELANGVDINFDTKGQVMDIDAPDNSFLAASVVKDVLHHNAYKRLEQQGVANKVESIEFRKGKAVEVEVGIPDPDTFIFDINGNFLVMED